MTINLTIWNEFLHENEAPAAGNIYPDGIHEAIAAHMRQQSTISVRTATLEEAEHGLPDAVLNDTDVLIWWGHRAHDRVADEVVDRVHQRVLQGMGLIVLHSGHYSKIFKRLMGTSCGLCWREIGEKERLWVVNSYHPITAGLNRYIELPQTEMYGEEFDIPEPDELIFISWFEGGEVFRSGATWHRGRGRVFYFRPGHETFPIYYDESVLQVLTNAVHWARFQGTTRTRGVGEAPNMREPIEPLAR
ncbi:MAG: ThuA domain-containing protein [Chloroflexota bacterium]|nr:ThuA domain-containing protein [Chloroflexota bacterium]